MKKTAGQSRSGRKGARKLTLPRVTEDGIALSPVDGRSVLGNLKIKPIEPPPFPSARQRLIVKTPSRKKEATSEPESSRESIAKRKIERQEGSHLKQKRPAAKPRVVFGNDGRNLHTPTNVFPNRAVCRLVVTYPLTPSGQSWVGTGYLIGSRHVLTAGHVLHKADEGGWSQTIRVIPGCDGNTWWFGSELLTWPNFRQRSVAGWSEDQDIDYDYGLITLNTGFPTLGSFGLLHMDSDTLESSNGSILGYPTARGNPRGTQQFGMTGGITDSDSTLVYYGIDTSGGQSGAGVYRFWGGKRAVFAVHGGAYDDDENRGARITKARYDKIRGWQNAD